MQLSAKEAAARLEISVATLYAYVSRGLLRSHPTPGSRARTWDADEVDAFRHRRDARKHPERVAQAVLDLGEPVLASGIALIQDGELYYRGEPAVSLAQHRTFEDVASLLWEGPCVPTPSPSPRLAATWPLIQDLPPIDRMSVALSLASVDDVEAWDLRPAAVVEAGGRILGVLAQALGGRPVGAPIATALAAQWGRPDATSLLNAALILTADHELNVSAFTARCVASAASGTCDVVGAGLSALRGARHGGLVDRVEALMRAASDQPERELHRRLRSGESIPGFGHPLYPDGDPRGRALLAHAASLCPNESRAALRLAAAGEALLGAAPTIDFGLATVGAVLKLELGVPLGLFALGRTAGWIAHALEQHQGGRLIRPRARYTGVQPPSVTARH